MIIIVENNKNKKTCSFCGKPFKKLHLHEPRCKQKNKNTSFSPIPESIKKIKGNLVIAFSDAHFGHEDFLQETFWYCIDKICENIIMLKQKYTWKHVFLIINGDVVTGTMIYRRQYLESHLNKNEEVIMVGAYLIHLIIERLESIVNMPINTFMIAGNHETGRSPLPHNFSVGIARRLSAYGHNVKYAAEYLILNIARDFEEEYNILCFHGWGSADYASASPSMVRELTRAHSQLSTYKGIIIKRFIAGHTHHLEIGRNVLGITIDVLGGFMKWKKTISQRESGMLYYIYNELGDIDIHPISAIKKQLEETESKWLNNKNLQYIANITREAFEYEIKKGLLKE